MEACDTYITKKEREMVSSKNVDLYKQIKIVSDISDNGNDIRIGTFKAISLRNPKLFTETQALFGKSYKLLDTLAAMTPATATEDLQLIDKCRAAGKNYDDCMTRFLKDWNSREENNAKRVELAMEVTNLAEKTTVLGMDTVTHGATSAATTLTATSGILIVGLLIGVAGGVVLSLVIGSGISKSITAITRTLSKGAAQTEAAATQIASSSQTLAEGASEQASSIEETSASLEEITSMTKRNAENAASAQSGAAKARAAAEDGTARTHEMQAAMTAIKEASAEMGDAIAGIKTSSDNVAKIIKTIDEIAFQTNILALNAAVEAARAGEAGAGFAVVAEEVRNLAQRSAEAAKETATMIDASVSQSSRGVEVNEKVTARIVEIDDKARAVQESLAEILAKAKEVDALAASVATASQEQTTGLDQIMAAMTQMDQITQKNAAGAEESSAAAGEMNDQSRELVAAVASLTHLVEGQGNEGEPASSLPAAPRPARSLHTAMPEAPLRKRDAGHRIALTHRNDSSSFHSAS